MKQNLAKQMGERDISKISVTHINIFLIAIDRAFR